MYYCCVIVNYIVLHCRENAEMQGQRGNKKKVDLVDTIPIGQSGENLLRFHGCHGYQSAARNVVVKCYGGRDVLTQLFESLLCASHCVHFCLMSVLMT